MSLLILLSYSVKIDERNLEKSIVQLQSTFFNYRLLSFILLHAIAKLILIKNLFGFLISK